MPYNAVRQQKILEAEGEAESIRNVQQALADTIRQLNEANPSQSVIAIKSLEAFQKAADGKATKIIIPSDLQGIAGLTKTIAEVARPDVTEKVD